MSESLGPFEFVYQDVKRQKRIQKRFSFSVEETSEETIPVFVRLKPTPEGGKNDFLVIDTGTNTLTIKKKSVEKAYKFTRILCPETTQEEVFRKCVKPYLRGFLDGTRRNVFMFTYGASGSGKTYTIQGDNGAPGIQPRLIAALFKSLAGRLGQSSPGKSPRRLRLEAEKTLLLSLAKSLVNMPITQSQLLLYSELEVLMAETEKMDVYNTDQYSVWFSYYEIYNEQVYDLLDEPRENRPHLRIVNDRNYTFVEGLRSVEVESLYEAYLVYIYGRYNLRISATGVNSRSSRSHSVFTVRLATDHTTSYRENQSSRASRPVPYRESKLTKVLGPAMTSPETSLTMIVTIGSGGPMEEAEAVLRASSVAASIKATTQASSRRCPDRGLLSTSTVAASIKASGRPCRDPGLLSGASPDWNEVAKKKITKTPEEVTSIPDVYKELHEERTKRIHAEERLIETEKMYKEKIISSETDCRCTSAEKKITLLQKELEEQEEDSMATRAEMLKLMKTIRIMKAEKATCDDQIKDLTSINQGLNEMLDDAREDIQTLQTEAQNLDRLLQEKQQIIALKDDRLHTLEVEIFELEENLEKNATEIEAYDKQLITVERELNRKKKEFKDLLNKYEELSAQLREKELELTGFKENNKLQNESLMTQIKDAAKQKTYKSENKLDPSESQKDDLENDSPRVRGSVSKSMSVTRITRSKVAFANRCVCSSEGNILRAKQRDGDESKNGPEVTSNKSKETLESLRILRRTLRKGKHY